MARPTAPPRRRRQHTEADAGDHGHEQRPDQEGEGDRQALADRLGHGLGW